MWFLVVLTIAGGYQQSTTSLAACTQALLDLPMPSSWSVREAYCINAGTGDKVYHVHNGKVVGLE